MILLDHFAETLQRTRSDDILGRFGLDLHHLTGLERVGLDLLRKAVFLGFFLQNEHRRGLAVGGALLTFFYRESTPTAKGGAELGGVRAIP